MNKELVKEANKRIKYLGGLISLYSGIEDRIRNLERPPNRISYNGIIWSGDEILPLIKDSFEMDKKKIKEYEEIIKGWPSLLEFISEGKADDDASGKD